MPKNIYYYYYLNLRIATRLVAMLFVFSSFLAAQHDYIHKTPLAFFDLPNSLEGNEVQDIYQDVAGYMWFASKAGLVRYDGRNFQIYRHRSSDTTSISHDEVEKILEARDGTMWIATWGGGLNRFDRKTGLFTRYEYTGDTENSLSNNYVADLVEDPAGHIWIATRNGLNKLDPVTEEFTVFHPEIGNEGSLSSSEIRTLFLDGGTTLWIGTGYPWSEKDEGGLNRLDLATEAFTRYLHDPHDEGTLRNNKVTALHEDKQGNFWVGTVGNHVHLLDRASGRFTYKEKLSQFRIIDSISQIRSFFQDPNDGEMWVLSYGSGLRKYRLQNDNVTDELFSMDEGAKSVFALNLPWKIYQSREGTLWICSGSIGEKVYKSSELMPHLGSVYIADHITSVYIQEENRNMWFGRQFNGLNFTNWETNDPSRTWISRADRPLQGSYSSGADVDSEWPFDHITTLIEGEDGIVWFAQGDIGQGLYRFDWQKGELRNFLHSTTNPNTLANDTLRHLVESGDGRTIWTTTKDGTLNRFNKTSEKTDRFSASNLQGFPESPRLLLMAGKEELWVAGYAEDGMLSLSRLQTSTMGVESYEFIALDRDDPPRLTGLQRSADQNFWVGAESHLLRLDATGATAVYPLPEEYGQMRSFLFDENGNIWMATTRGIAVFNVVDKDFFLFPEDYYLPAQPYQFRSAMAPSTEEFLFCGKGGCTYINAATIERYYNTKRKKAALSSDQIRFTAFLLNGKEMTEGPMVADSISHTRKLVLDYDQNNFSFELSLLDFDRPKDNDFFYRLEDYDSYWRQTGDRNTIYFAQVPPGEYTLRVKAYNSVGAYGVAQSLSITVLPPWWLTWWAYAGYALLVLAMVYAFYRFQLSRQLAKSEAQRLQDLNVAKSRLYTNITHEFRTPLTVILGMTDQLERSATAAQREQVKMIDRNGRSLLSLVNQMLDLAKLESGQMDLHLQQSDLISYLKYLVESFHSFAESRGVKIHFLSDLETQEMDFDAGKIQQVISNLLSNAIKFTPAGGDIYLSANTSNTPEKEILIQVRDTGAGIPEERLPYIFERFYQADDSHTREQSGTGIGLALVAEFVKLMEGTISAKSEMGKGTEIAIRLPIAQSAARTENLLPFAKEDLKAFHRERRSEVSELLPAATSSDRPTVLIVEDNFDVRQYLRACLADRFDLLTAENGQQGLEKAVEVIPDLIISDVMMPVKDGYTLAREIKGDQRTSHIPIIMLTAKADLNSRLEGLGHGVDAYLAKPFHPRELRLRIYKLLEQRDRLRCHYLGLSGTTPSTQNGAAAKAENGEDAFVLKIKDIILRHLDDTNLDVQLLTREIGMSQSQLHRKLTALTGLSANRFVRHVRLERAQSLLRDPERTISAVAYETGYRDPSYFGRVFKQATGMTPAEWRREAVV